MSNFHPLEVVGRGSDKQLQEGGNLNRIKGKSLKADDNKYICEVHLQLTDFLLHPHSISLL